MIRVLLRSLYFSCLLGFSFVSHPVVYCVLLLVSAVRISGLIYSVVGVSWYLALFCLVYIGGVYVLFIFVSIHSPNPVSKVGGGAGVIARLFVVFLVVFRQSLGGVPTFFERSHYFWLFLDNL